MNRMLQLTVAIVMPLTLGTASQAQSALAEIETDIDLAGYEPSTVRPTEAWLSARRHVVAEIGAVGSVLLLGADNNATPRAQIANRLETLAKRFAASELHPVHRAARQGRRGDRFDGADVGAGADLQPRELQVRLSPEPEGQLQQRGGQPDRPAGDGQQHPVPVLL